MPPLGTYQGVPGAGRWDYVVDNNSRWFLLDLQNGTRFEATGSGQRAALQQMFGEPKTSDPVKGGPIYLTGWNKGQDVVDLFGGARGIENVIAGTMQNPLEFAEAVDQQRVYTGPADKPVEYVIDNRQNHWLIDNVTRTRHELTGPGQRSAAQAMFGVPKTRDASGQLIFLTEGIGANPWKQGATAEMMYGGPGGMEKVLRGERPDPITGETRTPPVPTTPTPMDFKEQAKLLFPQWPDAALDVYVQNYVRTNDQALAIAAMRADARYGAEWFPGIKRPDGTMRHGEAEYFAIHEGYRNRIRAQGLNPDVFEERGLLRAAYEGESSPNEVAAKMQRIRQQLFRMGPVDEDGISFAAREFAAANGVEVSYEAILAQAFEPSIGEDILAGQITDAQIQGSALAAGFTRSSTDVRRLAGLMDPNQAFQFYTDAAYQLPMLQAQAERNQDFGALGIGQLEEAIVLRDPTQRRRLQQTTAAEIARFTPAVGFQENEEGALTGLLQQ